MKQQKFLFSLLLALIFVPAFAQPGLHEMQQVSQDLDHTFLSAQDASFMLAAIFGILGGLRIYQNWQMGKPHITSAVASWFFACLFMVLMGTFLGQLFGI